MGARFSIASWAASALALVSSTPALAWPNALRIETEFGKETGLYAVPNYYFLGAGAAVSLTSGLELVGGVRGAWGGSLPSAGVAGYARSSLFAAAGSYRPAVGLEFEATTATAREPDTDEPPGSMTRNYAKTNRDNSVRLAAIMSPARWQWQRVSLGVASLRLGTPLSSQCGDRVYLGVIFVSLGYSP